MTTSHRTNLLQLFGLCAFAVAWPFFQVVTKYPEFLILRGCGGAELAMLIVVALIPLPFALWLIELVVDRVSHRAGRVLHLGFCGILLAFIALPPLERGNRLGLEIAPIVIAAAVGIAGVWLLRRYHAPQIFLTLSGLGAPLFVFVFLSDPIIRVIAAPQDIDLLEGGRAKRAAPVVLLVLDALPVSQLLDSSMQIDPIRFPNFAAFARTGTWYPNATSIGKYTLVSVPAILDGRYPTGRSQPFLVDHQQNLFTLTWATHDRHVMEPLSRLCPAERTDAGFRLRAPDRPEILRDAANIIAHVLVPQAFRPNLPSLDLDWAGAFRRLDDPGSKEHDLRNWIRGVDAGERPRIYFAHTVLPHDPYFHLPSGRSYDNFITVNDITGPNTWREWGTGEWAIIQSQQRDLLQLGFVDLLLGELLERLRTAGIFDDAMIIITADHGLSFRPNVSRREISDENFFDILGVPLLIKYPGQTEAETSDLPAETIDILPTIADVLEIDLPYDVDGFSLRGEGARSRTHKSMFQRRRLFDYPLDSFGGIVESVELKIARFGDGHDDRIWEIGKEVVLLGASGPLLTQAESGRRRVSFEERERFDLVRIDVDPLPLGLIGNVELRHETEVVPLAIGLNGEIVAVTRNYQDADGQSFNLWAALLPEEMLIEGKNRVEVFEIHEDVAGEYRLTRTRD